jgi:predicted DNA-binding transcriptional regulator AlpA
MQQPATPAPVSPELLHDAVRTIVSALREHVVPPLWTIEDIASWMALSKSAVYKVVRQPGFPLPIRPSAQPRWFSDEVVSWAKRHRSEQSAE